MAKLETLAEAVLLQALADLWDRRHREESIAFLAGSDFKACASLAGMAEEQQAKLLSIVLPAAVPLPNKRKQRLAGRVFPSPRTLPVPPQPSVA